MSQVLPLLIRREIVYSIHKSNHLSKKIGKLLSIGDVIPDIPDKERWKNQNGKF